MCNNFFSLNLIIYIFVIEYKKQKRKMLPVYLFIFFLLMILKEVQYTLESSGSFFTLPTLAAKGEKVSFRHLRCSVSADSNFSYFLLVTFFLHICVIWLCLPIDHGRQVEIIFCALMQKLE